MDITIVMVLGACACGWLCLAFLYGFLRPLVTGLRELRTRGALSLEVARRLEANLGLACRVLGGLCIASIICWWPLSVISPLAAGMTALLFGAGCVMVWAFGVARFHDSLKVGGFGPDRLR